jgi:acyl carrier protein
LAAIWSDVLRLNQVGVHDNFTDLGGHSLLGTVLISRIRNEFEVELPLDVILDHPTIAALAAVVEEELIGRMNAQEMNAVVHELESISDDEARTLLKVETSEWEGSSAKKTCE